MQIIVTGAAGFIGSHVTSRFLGRGDHVIGIDNLSRPGNTLNLAWLKSLGKNFEFEHADIRSANDLMRIFSAHPGVEAVIHEAAQVAVTTSVKDPRGDFEANALGTFNVLEATRLCAPGAAFLYASTNKVYGRMDHLGVVEHAVRYSYRDLPGGVTESEPIDFYSPYGCSKGAAEQYVRDYARIFGLRTVTFRQSCIYGTRQYGMEDQGWVAWFTLAAIMERPITIYGDGKQVRDLLWIDDLVDLYLAALERIDVSAGKIYNAGGGPANTLSVLEVLGLLDAALGEPIPRKFSGWRPGDQRVFVTNSSKAKEELGWAPQVTPAEGVQKLIGWVLRNREMLETVLPPAPGVPAGGKRSGH